MQIQIQVNLNIKLSEALMDPVLSHATHKKYSGFDTI